jgi:hypothetical protein
MFKQTAELLASTAKSAEAIRSSNSVGREALRLLAERLCAVCWMRAAACIVTRVQSCAGKALAAVREHQAGRQHLQSGTSRLDGMPPSSGMCQESVP